MMLPIKAILSRMVNRQIENKSDDVRLTFGDHLEELRQMILRVICVSILFGLFIFIYKDQTWNILLAPSEYDFYTYRVIEKFLHVLTFNSFKFDEYNVDLISTELSSQFMLHITTTCYLSLLCASPYALYELFGFISPALREKEKKYSIPLIISVYVLFILGVLMTYYILFPISFRFLGTYSVAEKIHTSITLDSYISTFTTLTLTMGVVFQLPIFAFILAKMNIISARILSRYRKYAFMVIVVIAAIITPPDIMTLIFVSLPLYMLYEISIRIVNAVERNNVLKSVSK